VDGPLVSVVIVTYNGGAYIGRCLTSVAKQSYRDIDVTVVDNASTDDTLKQISMNFPDVKVIALGKNLEFCRANNLGMALSRGEYILILNQDVWITPLFIGELVAALGGDATAGIATCKLLRSDSAGLPVVPATIDNAGGHMLMRSRMIRERGYGERDVGQFNLPEYVFSASGAAAFFRRAALESVRYDDQYFDETFVAYKEDVDISWRCQALGWRTRYVPSAVGYHARGWGGPVRSITHRRAMSRARRRHSFKNRYLLLIKNESLSSVARDFPWIVWYEVRSLAFCFFVEPYLLSAFPDLVALLPDVLRKRRHLSLQRRIFRIDSVPLVRSAAP
jgi:GT2 family glycosyltransferase